MATKKNQDIISLNELFAEKVLECADGVKRTLKFTNKSMMHLEFLYDNKLTNIFDIFQGNLSAKHVSIALWACLVSSYKEFQGIGETEKEIAMEMMDFIPEDELLAVKFMVAECFASYWVKAKQAKQLPEKYRDLMESYEKEEAKKK